MDLQSHTDDFKRQKEKNDDGLTTWQTIELMSQAAVSYSGTKEPLSLVQHITARVSRLLLIEYLLQGTNH